MQFHWLNKQNNDNLIVFFAGWSFDFIPFKFLDCDKYDILCVYDYNEISNLPDFSGYKIKYLIAWSMGVYTAYQIRENFTDFNKKIAINGTPFPVDDEYGIPLKPFLLTLRHAKIGLEGKFYQNIFDKPEEYSRYEKNPVKRSIENRVDELNALYKRIKETPKEYTEFYNNALISAYDKIIPTKNQIKFWQDYNVSFKTLESGHFPYYNFKSWKDLL